MTAVSGEPDTVAVDAPARTRWVGTIWASDAGYSASGSSARYISNAVRYESRAAAQAPSMPLVRNPPPATTTLELVAPRITMTMRSSASVKPRSSHCCPARWRPVHPLMSDCSTGAVPT
jgi:hypothetical protein